MHMSRITFTAEEHHKDIIGDVRKETGIESTAGVIRECIERAAELQHREEELQQRIDDLKEEHEQKRAELEREHAQERDEYEERIADLEEQLEAKENTISELRRQLAATNRRVDQHQELVEYVEQQRDLERYRARREQMLDQAGILSRWKWKITGVPVEDSDE
jgi:uncharacterized coiled-coil protein SlyX